MMRKALLLPLAAVAVLSLSACGKKAANEAAEANESVGGDSNTMGEAVTDVNAAENAAFGAAENAYAEVPAAEAGDANEIME
jgi:protein involved in sex pheromone biosynthesis